MTQTQQNITVRDVLKVLFRRKLIILLTLFVSIGSVYLGVKWRTPLYYSEATLLVSAKKQVEASYYRELLDFRQAEIALTQSEIVKSVSVLEPVVKALRLDRRPEDHEMQFASTIKKFFRSHLDVLEAYLDEFYDMLGIGDPLLHLSDDTRSEIMLLRAIKLLEESVSIKVIKNTDLFVIGVEDYDPLAAATIANVISRSYVVFDLEQQLAEVKLKFGEKHQEVQQIRDNIEQIQKFMDGRKLGNVDAIGPATVKIISQASIPLAPMGKSARFLMLLTVGLGLAMGVILAFLSDFFDQTVKSPEEIESYLEVPFIAHIPPKTLPRGKNTLKKVSGNRQVIYQGLSDHLFILLKNSRTRTLLLAESGEQAQGPAITVQVGMAMAEKGDRRVLLVDADFRQPSISQYLSGDPLLGILDILESKAEFKDAVVACGDDFFILPKGSGSINPTTYLASQDMRELLNQAADSYDVVLVYCADIRHAKDVMFLIEHVPDIAIFINSERNRKMALQRNIMELKKNGAKIAGAILSGPRSSIPNVIYRRL